MMKKSPQMQKLEETLRSSKLVAGGFMGSDTRSITEIVDADRAEVSKLGITVYKIAARMQHITDIAKSGLGNWVKVDNKRQAVVKEARGAMLCPWPHSGRFAKRITTVKNTETGESICWADLNVHLISEHSVFEGRS